MTTWPARSGCRSTFFAARDEMLRGAAAGRHYAVAMSERGAGSRLSQATTSVRAGRRRLADHRHQDVLLRRGSRGCLRGRRKRGDAVSQFLVPAGPGVTVVPTWDSLGMRATVSHDIELDVVVPADALLGQVEGMALLLAQVMPQWLVASYAAVYVGVAQAALTAATEYVDGRGLGRLPMVRARLGRADAAVAAAREVVRAMAQAVTDAPGEPATNRWVWRAKLVAGETAMDVAASLLEACGTAATRRGSALERLYRDARCGSLQPATSDVCADWLGYAALGRDPDADAEVPRW